jgi:biotin carboxylase
MASAAKAAGLRVPDTLCTRSLQNLQRWRKQRTVVIKPRWSAGSEDVHVCRSREEVEHAFEAVIDTRDKFGNRNTTVLAQEFIEGDDEFAVNCVSRDGVHRTVLIWKYTKRLVDGSPIYVHDDTVHHSNSVVSLLQCFVHRLLDALEIFWGASHAEVKIDCAGPVLIEIAARMDGGLSPQMDAVCVGRGNSQLDLTVDSYLSKHSDLSPWDVPYRLRQHGRIAHLIADRGGGVLSPVGMTKIGMLESRVNDFLRVRGKEDISMTTDLATSPGHVFLTNRKRLALERDYRAIRDLEGGGQLYRSARLLARRERAKKS